VLGSGLLQLIQGPWRVSLGDLPGLVGLHPVLRAMGVGAGRDSVAAWAASG